MTCVSTSSFAGTYDFRVLDDRDNVMSEMKLELLHFGDVLALATVVASEITMSHPNVDCRNWSVEITAPSGTPFTSLPFDGIALYGPAQGKRTDAESCSVPPDTQSSAQDRWRTPKRHTLH